MTKYVLTIVNVVSGSARCLVTRYTETVDEYEDGLAENEVLFVNEFEGVD